MKAYQCDQCGKLIDSNDIRITVKGYEVLQNRSNNNMPKGFGINYPQDFCSFTCLSGWALEQQEMLDEYMNISKENEL